jgi:uncharacterized protein (TIGR02145 family)
MHLRFFNVYAVFVCIICFSCGADHKQDDKTSQNIQTKPEEVTIAAQVWQTNNLNVTTFSNGESILQAKNIEDIKKAELNQQPIWCFPNFDQKLGDSLGLLYNWYAIKDPRGITPPGYRIPTVEDYISLCEDLGGKCANERRCGLGEPDSWGIRTKYWDFLINNFKYSAWAPIQLDYLKNQNEEWAWWTSTPEKTNYWDRDDISESWNVSAFEFQPYQFGIRIITNKLGSMRSIRLIKGEKIMNDEVFINKRMKDSIKELPLAIRLYSFEDTVTFTIPLSFSNLFNEIRNLTVYNENKFLVDFDGICNNKTFSNIYAKLLFDKCEMCNETIKLQLIDSISKFYKINSDTIIIGYKLISTIGSPPNQSQMNAFYFDKYYKLVAFEFNVDKIEKKINTKGQFRYYMDGSNISYNIDKRMSYLSNSNTYSESIYSDEKGPFIQIGNIFYSKIIDSRNQAMQNDLNEAGKRAPDIYKKMLDQQKLNNDLNRNR